MIIFNELIIQNFLSYGNTPTVVNLEQPGTTLIIGEDLDNTSNGRGGNGCGKSALLNALVYALYDKPISDISKDNLINNINKKNMVVTLKFVGDDGVKYEVRRERGMKSGASGNNVYLYINGEDKTLDSQAATNVRIAQIVGIPYELFVRIVVFSASHAPFLDIKTEQQKEIIEELFGLTAISQKAELLKLEIKDTKMRIQLNKTKLDSLIAEHERHNLQVDNAKKRVITWQEQHDANLEQMKGFTPAAPEDYDGKVAELQHKTQEMVDETRIEVEELRAMSRSKAATLRGSVKQQLDQLRSDLKRQVTTLQQKEADDTDELVRANEQLSKTLTEQVATQTKYTQEQSGYQADKKRYTTEATKYAAEINHLQDKECPYCHQSFAEADQRIAAVEEQLEILKAQIAQCDESSAASAANVASLQDELIATKSLISANKANIETVRAAIRADIRTIEADIGGQIATAEGGIETEIKSLEKKIESSIYTIQAEEEYIIKEYAREIELHREHKNQFERNLAKYNELINATNPYIDPLDDIINTAPDVIDYTPLNETIRELEHQEFLLKLLTKKDSFIRKALLNKNVPLLNTRLRYYLSHLGLPHKVEFTKEMAATISQFGRELDFGNLSAGQRARVNFALSLAFRDVLQNLHPKINICLLDEILDTALDSVGVQAAAKIIKQKAREEGLSMYVISHRDEIDSVFNNKMVIQMSGGFSNIKAKYEDTLGPA